MIEPREAVKNTKPYKPPLEGRRGRIRLDFNENTTPLEALPDLSAEIVGAYPEYEQFYKKLSEFLGIPRRNLMLVNGTGEALLAISFTFIEPGTDAAITSSPTFALIPHYLKLAGSKLIEVPAKEDWHFDVDAIEESLSGGVKLAVFASPENPTGVMLKPEIVKEWCGKYPGTLFVIDEAYAEYCDATVLPYAAELGNLLVLRTFSKAWGLAGLRLGFAAGNPELLDYIQRLRPPYSVNSAAVLTALERINNSEEIKQQAKLTMSRKPGLVESVARRGFKTYSAQGNFFLLMAGIDSEQLCEFCKRCGVLVRSRSSIPGMEGIARVTVGTDSENKAFLDCLDAFRWSRAVIFDLDDTLVDTSESYDAAIIEIVKRFSGETVERSKLLGLRAEGGFNNDWDASKELLRRRGVEVEWDTLAEEGRKVCFKLAPENEKLLVDIELLKKLSKRYRLFLATGRPRDEYEGLWSDTFDPVVEKAYCCDNIEGLKPKPAPDLLKAIIGRHGIEGGYYVGNLVDDMKAAVGAGLEGIGVTTNTTKENLLEAGAKLVIETTPDIRKVFML